MPNTPPISDEQAELFVDACRRAARYGLLRYSSGNLSWRFEPGRVAITTKGAWLGELRADQVAVCALNDGRCLNDKPMSVESRMHLGVLRRRGDADVVLHFQSPYATAIACGRPEQHNFAVIPEVPLYVGTPGVVPYITPGSAELADAVSAAAGDHDLIILQNHGLIALGKCFESVIQRAGFFELACQVMLTGGDTQRLSADQIDALRAYLNPSG